MCVSETVLLHDKMEKIETLLKLLEQNTWKTNFWFQLMHNVGTCKGTRLWKSDTPMDLNQRPPCPKHNARTLHSLATMPHNK